VHPVLRLQIHLRVPVGVENNDSVCSLKVQTQSSGASTQQKDIVLTVWLVEQLHAFFPVFSLGGAVEPEVPHSFELEIGLHDVHEMRHLREDEQPVSEPAQLGQDAVDELELSRRTDDPLVVADVVVVFEEEIGVVAALPQLHHQVGQSGLADLPGIIGELKGRLAGNVVVDEFLPGGKLHLNHMFLLVGQFRVHFLLDSPQQKGP